MRLAVLSQLFILETFAFVAREYMRPRQVNMVYTVANTRNRLILTWRHAP